VADHSTSEALASIRAAINNPKWVVWFWSKVDKSAGDDACWPWTSSIGRKGYGRARLGGGHTKSAHVLAWILLNGELPANKPWGLHRCDNPPCCNPKHVFAGTSLDNVTDRHAKGRDARGDRNGTRLYPGLHRGERNGRAKITADTVHEVRRRFAAGERLCLIARRMNVPYNVVTKIRMGVCWAWLKTEEVA